MPLDHVLCMKMYYKQCAIGSCICMKMYYKQCAIGLYYVWKCIINNVPLDHVLYMYENVL